MKKIQVSSRRVTEAISSASSGRSKELKPLATPRVINLTQLHQKQSEKNSKVPQSEHLYSMYQMMLRGLKHNSRWFKEGSNLIMYITISSDLLLNMQNCINLMGTALSEKGLNNTERLLQ